MSGALEQELVRLAPGKAGGFGLMRHEWRLPDPAILGAGIFAEVEGVEGVFVCLGFSLYVYVSVKRYWLRHGDLESLR